MGAGCPRVDLVVAGVETRPRALRPTLTVVTQGHTKGALAGDSTCSRLRQETVGSCSGGPRERGPKRSLPAAHRTPGKLGKGGELGIGGGACPDLAESRGV